jgi:diacylglycerol O-acyltransferase / wax synthase
MASDVLGASFSSYRLSSQDASFIYAESNSGPLHIGSISLFEGTVDYERLVRHLEDRIHLIPRYRQRLRRVPLNLAHALMEDDPHFKVRNHLHRHQIAPGATEPEAIAQIMRDYEKPLDRSMPLWAGHLYEGFPRGRSAMVWQVHHCLVDGVSGVELLKATYDFRPEPVAVPPPETPWKAGEPASALSTMIDGARETTAAAFKGAARAMRELYEGGSDAAAERAAMIAKAMRVITELASRPLVATPWNGIPITQRRALGWTRHSFAEFRAIREVFGGSVNDVVLTVLTEGAARYLKHHGYPGENRVFCVGCPVNVRHKTEQTSLGNRVSMMFPTTPAEPMDVVERLEQIKHETERIKAEGYAQALELLITLGDNIPPTLIGALSRVALGAMDAASSLAERFNWTPRAGRFTLPAIGINFIATNVPGVQVPLYLLGHQCLDMIPLVPLAATVGYGVAMLSYNQNLYFGFSAEPRVMPDVELMRSYVDDAFAELRRRCEERAAETAAVAAPVSIAAAR